MTETIRLTVAQATVRFLAQQYALRDGKSVRAIEGILGIFGHGNVAGLGQALLESELEDPERLPYRLVRNEQGAVHAAAAFAKHRNRMSTLAVTTSIGPGATNLVTGAALATINRLPVLLLPADSFSTRRADPVLQQLERPDAYDITVNDALRPVSAFFDRVTRPEQLPQALMNAMRVLTDPVQTGAVTIAFPQDTQAEGFDWPIDLFRRREWRIARPVADADSITQAAIAIRSSVRPLIIAGGGIHYSEAQDALARLSQSWGIPVGQTHAGKGVLPHGHRFDVGGIGATGTTAANRLAAEADLVIGLGTRYSDFTSASRSLFANPDVRFLNVNVSPMDAAKFSGLTVTGDALATLEVMDGLLSGFSTFDEYQERVGREIAEWSELRSKVAAGTGAGLPAQSELICILNEELGPLDVIVNAAGSAPGEFQRLWQPKSARQYHVEYGYSTMGYEIAGALGVKLASLESQVVAFVGDGSYLMLSQEIVTAVAEGLKLVIVLSDNGGFASIGDLSESVGSQRFGTGYLHRNPASRRLDGLPVTVDFASNLASLGADVLVAETSSQFRSALKDALKAAQTTAIYIRTDPYADSIPGGAWWDVAISEVAALDSTNEARKRDAENRRGQNPYL
ncbi:MAG: 3D-(3,5/4)-trihydroxycyclohexane-1,2-dione acylhydrolase (decyclizing) [Cryobacterium sp.]|nr:3D-(3,5/4)-trihydroxycyclohexane-1,2-dione acylhydrolase (decyclizing) [Cryobacterium sp.]